MAAQKTRQAIIAKLGEQHTSRVDAQSIGGVGTWHYNYISGSITWSEEEYRIFGVTPDTFKPTFESFLAFVHPDDRGGLIAADEASWRGEPMDFRHRIVRPDGEVRYVHQQAQAIIRDESTDQPTLVGTTQDITERQKAEETVLAQAAEMRELHATLQSPSRSAGIGPVAATLAHEISQPLTAISSYATALRKMADIRDAPSEISEGLAAIVANTMRAGEIIRRMRTIAQEGRVKKEQVDLHRILRDSCRAVGSAHEDAEFDYDHRGTGVVMADRVQIEQVAINLIKNACEAVEEADTQKVTISTSEDEEFVTICILDTGAGVSAEVDLFEATSSSKADGMGIGLFICRTIVEAHGGRIWSEPITPGACFCFTLPK
jgi:PAS domain S-box-containing protein